MIDHRECYRQLLNESGRADERFIEKFDLYMQLLLEANSRVNLISRQTVPEELWTKHFSDSIIPMSLGFEFEEKTVLDFGTGGGLPGIALALINQSGKFLLLDSRAKKILELKKIIKKLDLKNCYPICYRLEDIKREELAADLPDFAGIDIIVCRSVKLTARLLKKMKVLLKESGYILLYKGKEVDESWLLKEAETPIHVKNSWGERTILKINKI